MANISTYVYTQIVTDVTNYTISVTTDNAFPTTTVTSTTTSVTHLIISSTELLSTVAEPNDEFVFDSYPQRAFIAGMLLLATIVGTIGNGLVILAVLFAQKLHTVTNIFVFNLAAADLLVSLNLPWNAVALLARDGWPLPGFFCSAAAGIVVVCVGCSVYTLASIAVTRLFIITKSIQWYNHIFTKKLLFIWITLTWLLPFFVGVVPPMAGFGQLGYNPKYSSCSAISTAPYSNEYDILTTVVFFPVSLLIMIVSYAMVFHHVRQHTKRFEKTRRETIVSDGRSILPQGDSAGAASNRHDNTDSTTLSSSLPTRVEEESGKEGGNVQQIASKINRVVNLEDAQMGTDSTDDSLFLDDNAPSDPTTNNTTYMHILATPKEALVTEESAPVAHVNTSFVDDQAETKVTDSNDDPVGSVPTPTTTSNEDNIKLSESTRNILKEIDHDKRPKTTKTITNSRGGSRKLNTDILKNISLPRPKLSHHEIEITKNMFYVVVAFLISFTPFTFCMIIDSSDPFLPYATAVLFINSCINPIIYAIKHLNFKTTFRAILRCRLEEIKPPSQVLRMLRDKGACCCKHDGFTA